MVYLTIVTVVVVSDNAKILILKQITTFGDYFVKWRLLCLIMQRY